MSLSNAPPDIWELLTALVISVIAGFISIGRRIVLGHNAGWLWIISEFATAILCGYLMHQAYPGVHLLLPSWVTEPVMVAFAAHSGGRMFQEAESVIIKQYSLFTGARKLK
jgi:hypothetical protein